MIISTIVSSKVNWDRLRKDYIDNFVPLAVDFIRPSDPDIVSLPALQKGI